MPSFDRISSRAGIAAVPVAFDRPIAGGVSFRAGRLIDADGYTVDFSDVPTLPGDHNAQNAACAWAACRWLDVPRELIVAGLRSYPGLPHRQERVASVGNVVYINDSKATNADATARALSSYRDIYWIAGGQAKEGGVAPLASYFDRIRHAFLIGEASRAVRRPARRQAAPTAAAAISSRRSTRRTSAPSARRPDQAKGRPSSCSRRPARRGISGRVTSIAVMRFAPWRGRCPGAQRLGRAA